MKKNMIATNLWDASEHLESTEDMAAYLETALENGDPTLITAVLGDIVRAKGMDEIAKKTGLDRTSLNISLSIDGHPEFTTVLKVITALGIKLKVTAIH